MANIFDDEKCIETVDITNLVCHSGGAIGSDTYFEIIGKEYGIKTNAYSYMTEYHTSKNKVEISEDDFEEGILEIKKANILLKRRSLDKYINLLARNWAQVKYSDQVFAIGKILKYGELDNRGYISNCRLESVMGGTGWACQICINHEKELFVFDQIKNKWFKWSYISSAFLEMKDNPTITKQNFAGIGTRNINENGINAIKELYKNTFNK